MYIGKKREEIICSDIILSYFNGRNREFYKMYVEPENTPGVESGKECGEI